MEGRTDTELVRAAGAGDRRAFALLLERHRGRAALVAGRLLNDRHEGEDAAQEAALTAFLELDRLERPERFGAWLCGIAVNVARMRLRRRRPVVPLDVAAAALEPTPDQRLEAAEQLSLISSAIALLPPGQRELVLLYYLEGLSPREIAALLGRSAGSVRVGLHRARSQLRDRLRPLAPSRKEPQMIEMSVEDVVVRIRDDEPPALAAEHRIVLLRERGGERVLPIWVGPAEGDALAFQLAGESTPRPLTVDLTVRLLQAVGATVERVVVNSLLEKTFYAVVTIANGNGDHEVDARPSDALNLATRAGAPVFVDEAVLDESAIAADDVFGGLDREREKFGEAELEGAWRSLSPELVRAVGAYRVK